MRGLKAIAMTSNGIALERKLLRLKEAGLSKLNISLDTLVPEKFESLTRRKGHSKVLSCIDSAIQVCKCGRGPRPWLSLAFFFFVSKKKRCS